MDLSGKRIVVAGAAGGMGRVVTDAVLGAGGNVVAVDRDEAGLQELATAHAASGRLDWKRCDLSDPHEVQAFADDIADLDGLVNLQGVATFAPLSETGPEEWNLVLGSNLTSVFLTCRALLPKLSVPSGGVIVNVASTGGLFGIPDMVAYCAAKHGVVGLTRALAMEAASAGVRVNCIAPGATVTPMLMSTTPEYRRDRAKRVPAGRLGEARDQANAVVFLLSDASSYITGAVLPVDGGISALAPGTSTAAIAKES